MEADVDEIIMHPANANENLDIYIFLNFQCLEQMHIL